jgi:hypothetical protein
MGTSPPSPLTRFTGLAITRPIRRRLRVSMDPCLALPDRAPKCTAGQDRPYGVFAPAFSWAFERADAGAMNSPLAGLHITASHTGDPKALLCPLPYEDVLPFQLLHRLILLLSHLQYRDQAHPV